LEIATNDRDITTITADSSTFKLHGMPKGEYPALPDLSGAFQIHIKQGELKDLFFRTAFAVSKEDNRYVLTGVNLQVSQGSVLFIGTDGKRLARAHCPVGADVQYAAECIIPIKAVDEIVKSLTDDDEEAILSILPDKIAVEAGDVLIITKLLTGDYPDINKVIPQQTQATVTLHREELMSLLRQVSLFIVDMNHSVRFTFMPGELHLSANTMDVGEGKVSMPMNYSGERFDIAFNPHFFLDILRHSKKETISMGFSDPYNPGVITDGEHEMKNGAHVSPLFVLMPMRLNEAAV
jgi:DNA polymerase-3 subunit beta